MSDVLLKYGLKLRALLLKRLVGPVYPDAKKSDEDLAKEIFSSNSGHIHGWISPRGEYHRMKPDEEHGQVIDRMVRHGSAYGKGWLSVGHAGGNNIVGDHEVLSNPHHPATAASRKLVGESLHPDTEVTINGGEGHFHKLPAHHYAKHGVPSTPGHSPLFRNEECIATGPVLDTTSGLPPTADLKAKKEKQRAEALKRLHKNLELLKAKMAEMQLKKEMYSVQDKDTMRPFHGIVGPKGEFHSMSPNEFHYDAIHQARAAHGYPKMEHRSADTEAAKEGWVLTGVGGTPAIYGHHKALSDPSHPATKRVAQMVRALPPHVTHIEATVDHPDPKKYETIKVPRHMAEKGIFKKPSAVQMFRSLGEKLDVLKGVLQRLHRYNPHQEVDEYEAEPVSHWTHGIPRDSADDEAEEGLNLKNDRESIPRLTGVGRVRALHHLAGKTDVRRAKDGKREFLLHRGMSGEEFAESHKKGVVSHSSSTSWTPHRKVAQGFANEYKHNDTGGDRPSKVVSAWVHEDNIHHIPNQLGNVSHPLKLGEHFDDEGEFRKPKGPAAFHQEHEVIVSAGHKSKQHVSTGHPTLDQTINLSGSGHIVSLSRHLKQRYGDKSRRPAVAPKPQAAARAPGFKPPQQLSLKLSLKEKVDILKGYLQRKVPYKPPTTQQKLDPMSPTRHVYDWQGGGYRASDQVHPREAMSHMGGDTRTRALHHLAANTKVRRAKDGGREFLLHRGMSADEHAGATGIAAKRSGHINHDVRSSWTPHHHIAHNMFGGAAGGKETASAWIHEKHIVNVPKQIGGKGGRDNVFAKEHEVVVERGHDSERAKPEEVKPSGIHHDINTRDKYINDKFPSHSQLRAAGGSAVSTNLLREKLHRLRGVTKSLIKNDPIQASFDVHGLQVNIEWPKGSTRHYKDGFKRDMHVSYGYIRGTDGDDGEELDAYLGDHLDCKRAFIIDQLDTKGGEEKVMLGFRTPEEAKEVFLAHMAPKNFGAIREVSIQELKDRISKKPSSLPQGDVAGQEGVRHIVK